MTTATFFAIKATQRNCWLNVEFCTFDGALGFNDLFLTKEAAETFAAFNAPVEEPRQVVEVLKFVPIVVA